MSIAGDISQPLLTLSETETIFILSIDSSIVADNATDLETIKQRNERYVEVKIKKKTFFLSFLYICLFSYVKVNKVVIYSVIMV